MNKKRFSGSLTVEASLALTFFIIGYLVIISLVYTVRAEKTVQQGINRTASEIARYCYAAERLSLTQYIEQAGITAGEAIDSIGGFANLSAESEKSGDSSGSSLAELADRLSGEAYLSGIAGEPVIRAVFAGCASGGGESADEKLKRLAGITSGDIDFRYSSLLKDGKTVEIVAVYRVKLKTFGLFGKKGITLTMKNTAVTSAWVTEQHGPGDNISTKWSLTSFERGRAWVSEIKAENSMTAVKSGKGIDLCIKGCYSMISSVNLFTKTYTDCSVPGSTSPDDYTVKEEELEKILSGYAAKLLECIDKHGMHLVNEKTGAGIPDWREISTGELIIVVPAEASESARIKLALENTAARVLENTGVEVKFEYREKALF